jgi:hypothetical protein
MANKRYFFGFDLASGKDHTAYTPFKKEGSDRVTDSSLFPMAIMSESEKRLVNLGKCPYCTGDLEDKPIDCEYRFLFCKPCNKFFITDW